MNKTLGLAILSLASTAAQAGELDGKTFCRTVKSDGSFGQPRGEREHCVSFEEDSMVDNSSTFFGNPPVSVSYVLVGEKILLVNDGELQSPYRVNSKLTEISDSLKTLKLKTVKPRS